MFEIHNELIRPIVSAVLAASVYLGLYIVTGYAMDTLPAIGITAALNAGLAFSVSLVPMRDSLFAAFGEFLDEHGAAIVAEGSPAVLVPNA